MMVAPRPIRHFAAVQRGNYAGVLMARALLERDRQRAYEANLPDHGTYSRYNYHKCRCPKCQEANAEYRWSGEKEKAESAGITEDNGDG